MQPLLPGVLCCLLCTTVFSITRASKSMDGIPVIVLLIFIGVWGMVGSVIPYHTILKKKGLGGSFPGSLAAGG